MRVVAPASIALMATPARTMPWALILLNFDKAKIKLATIIDPRKESRGIWKAPLRLKTTIAKAAPKLAPWETPIVEAEARLFCRIT